MGFFEVLIIGIVALLVFGPERLPKVIYDVSRVWRSIRQSAGNIRREFEQSVVADVKADIHNNEVMKTLEENKIAVEETLHGLKQPLEGTTFDLSDTSKEESTKASGSDSSNTASNKPNEL